MLVRTRKILFCAALIATTTMSCKSRSSNKVKSDPVSSDEGGVSYCDEIRSKITNESYAAAKQLLADSDLEQCSVFKVNNFNGSDQGHSVMEEVFDGPDGKQVLYSRYLEDSFQIVTMAKGHPTQRFPTDEKGIFAAFKDQNNVKKITDVLKQRKLVFKGVEQYEEMSVAGEPVPNSETRYILKMQYENEIMTGYLYLVPEETMSPGNPIVIIDAVLLVP
jgi:hypothetical protein